jgi:hypothetical protein
MSHPSRFWRNKANFRAAAFCSRSQENVLGEYWQCREDDGTELTARLQLRGRGNRSKVDIFRFFRGFPTREAPSGKEN